MPSSSLDSLSSPSPSPAPMDQAHTAPDVDPAALDSGSELSDLTEDDPQPSASGQRHASQDLPRQRRKKRGGIIPPRMWDWAMKGTNPEEEEEDQPGPPRIMEEEEDDEDHISDMHRRQMNHLLLNGVTPIRPGLALNGATHDDLSDEDEDDEDDEPSHDLVRRPRASASLGSGKPPRSASAELSDDDDVSGTENEDEEEDDDIDSKHPIADNTLVDNDIESEGSDVDDDDDDGAVPGDDDDPEPVTPLLAVPAVSTPADALMEVDIDVTAPPASLVAPVAAAAALSSIMAGSTVIEEPSPTSSASSSPSPSVASSRSPSPASISIRNQKPLSKGVPAEKKDVAPTSTAAPAGADAEDVEVEVDDEPEPEADALEADLQPAHRAEALDMLALIELKFALLRERLYVEKMEQLAWEEKLIEEGIHPELIHLHDELLKRRNIRIELATRKRNYEVAMTTRRREVEEDAVWSTWKFQRDQLQTDMIAEANRKRRRLEREQKALSRPVPIRRIPAPPIDVPPAPALREILKAQPFAPAPSDARPARSGSRRKVPSAALPNSYPELHSLAPSEVMNDLGLLFQQRRNLDYQRQLQNGVTMHPHDAYPPNGPPPSTSMTNGMDPRNALPGYGLPHPPDGGGSSLAIMDAYGQPIMAQQQGYPPSLMIGRQPHHLPPHMMEVDPMYQQHPVPAPSYGGQLGMRRSPSPVMSNPQAYPPNGWTDEQYRRMGEMEAQRRPKDRDRETERRRDMRDSERDRAKERGRERERDRERERNMQMDAAQQQQHRMHSHAHTHPGGFPPPGQGAPHAHAQGPHHHHHHHHHRHIHGPQAPYGNGGPSLQPPGYPLDAPSGAGSHPSQRVPSSREIDFGKPSPNMSAMEINLTPSSNFGARPPVWDAPHGGFGREREREREREWEREKEREREREREWARPSSSHSMHSAHEERPAMPFVLPPSSHTMHMGGSGPNTLAGSGRSSFNATIGGPPDEGPSLPQPSVAGTTGPHQPIPSSGRGTLNGTLSQPRDQMLPPSQVPSRPHSSLMSPTRHNGPHSPRSAPLGSPTRPTPSSAPPPASFLPPPSVLAGIGSDAKDGPHGSASISNGQGISGGHRMTSPPPPSYGSGPYALSTKASESIGALDRARSVTPGAALPILPPKMGVA